jgi:hypothetical protein
MGKDAVCRVLKSFPNNSVVEAINDVLIQARNLKIDLSNKARNSEVDECYDNALYLSFLILASICIYEK